MRHRGNSNPRGQSPMDFESISLATQTQCHAQCPWRHHCICSSLPAKLNDRLLKAAGRSPEQQPEVSGGQPASIAQAPAVGHVSPVVHDRCIGEPPRHISQWEYSPVPPGFGGEVWCTCGSVAVCVWQPPLSQISGMRGHCNIGEGCLAGGDLGSAPTTPSPL